MIDTKLVNLLLDQACVQGFIEVTEVESDVALLNKIYGTDLEPKSGKAIAKGSVIMQNNFSGALNFALPSINFSDLSPNLFTPESELKKVPSMLIEFLRVRYFDVTRLAGWINGKSSTFKEDFYNNPDFWSTEPSKPPYAAQKSFYPKVQSSQGYLDTKLMLINTYAIKDSLWAARLFLDKVCFPNQLYLSLKVTVEGELGDLTKFSINKKKSTIEFLPFNQNAGSVLCQVKFKID